MDRNAVAEDRCQEIGWPQFLLGHAEAGRIEAVEVSDAADIGARLEDLQMDRQFAWQRCGGAVLTALQIDNDEIVRGDARAEAVWRDQDAVRDAGAGADMAEAFDEAAVVEKAPCLGKFVGKRGIVVHDGVP